MKEKNISDSLGEAIEGYFTNKLTQSQADELLEWLGKNEENRSYLLELGQIWFTSSQLSTRETEPYIAWENLLNKSKKMKSGLCQNQSLRYQFLFFTV
jgi:hypothetical protein